MTIDISKYKTLLEKELSRLEQEISLIAKKEGDSNWEGIQTETNIDTADREDVADGIENYISNETITSDLESDIIEVKEALERINSGDYGNCEVCGKEIEEERLDANPESKTCIEHKQ